MDGEWAADSNLPTVTARRSIQGGTHVVIGAADKMLGGSSGGGRSSRGSTIVSMAKLVVLLPFWVLRAAVCCVAQCFLPDSILYGSTSTASSKARMTKMSNRRSDRQNRRGAGTQSNTSSVPQSAVGGVVVQLDGSSSGIRPLPWAVVSTDISAYLLGEKMNIAATSFFIILEVVALWFIATSHHHTSTTTTTCTGPLPLWWCGLPTDHLLLTLAANVAYGVMLSGKRVNAPFVGLGSVLCTCTSKECTAAATGTAPAIPATADNKTSDAAAKTLPLLLQANDGTNTATTTTATIHTQQNKDGKHNPTTTNIDSNQVHNTMLLLRAADILKRSLDIIDPRVALLMPADQHRRRDMDLQNRKASSSPTINTPKHHHHNQHTHAVEITPFGEDEDGGTNGGGGGGGAPLLPWQSSTERLLDQYVPIPRTSLGLPTTSLLKGGRDDSHQQRYDENNGGANGGDDGGGGVTYSTTTQKEPEAAWVLAVLSRFASQHEFQGGTTCGDDEVVVPSWMWCQYCCCLKPLRAKHCHTCGRCVHDQDHHCPWVGSCVGGKNLGQFLVLVMCMAGGIGRGVVALIQVSSWGRHVSMGLMQIQLLLILGGSLTFILVCFPMAMSVAAITTGRTSYEIFRHTPYDRLLTLRSRIRKVSDTATTTVLGSGGGLGCAGVGKGGCSPTPPWYIIVARWYAFLCTPKHQDIERSSTPTSILGGCAVVQSHNRSQQHYLRRDGDDIPPPPRQYYRSFPRWGILSKCMPRRVVSVCRRVHEGLVGIDAREGSLEGLLDDIDSYLE